MLDGSADETSAEESLGELGAEAQGPICEVPGDGGILAHTLVAIKGAGLLAMDRKAAAR